MNDSTIFVGLDVHKESIVAAYSIGLGEVQSLGNIGLLQRDLDRLCARMQSVDTDAKLTHRADLILTRGRTLFFRFSVLVEV